MKSERKQKKIRDAGEFVKKNYIFVIMKVVVF